MVYRRPERFNRTLSNWHFNPFERALYVCGTSEIIRMASGGCHENFPPRGPAHNEIKIISSIIHVDTFAEFSTRENERKFSSGYKGSGTSASRRARALPLFSPPVFSGAFYFVIFFIIIFLRFESPRIFCATMSKVSVSPKKLMFALSCWGKIKISLFLTMGIIFLGNFLNPYKCII